MATLTAQICFLMLLFGMVIDEVVLGGKEKLSRHDQITMVQHSKHGNTWFDLIRYLITGFICMLKSFKVHKSLEERKRRI